MNEPINNILCECGVSRSSGDRQCRACKVTFYPQPAQNLADDDIERALREQDDHAQAIGKMISQALPEGLGFCLLVYQRGLNVVQPVAMASDAESNETLAAALHTIAYQLDGDLKPVPQIPNAFDVEHVLDFVVPGKPQTWQRTNLEPKTKRPFQPKETREYQKSVRFYAKRAIGERGGWIAEKGLRYRIRIEAHWDTKHRRDLDNLCKSVCDGLNEVAYDDDAQLDYVELHRVWCEKGAMKTVVKVAIAPETQPNTNQQTLL